MVDSKRYNPSNKRFQKHTQHFVENTTMKGHITQEKDKKKGKYKDTGYLIKIKKNALDGKGWYVKIDKKTLQCNYGDNIIYLPPYTEKGEWYIPKKKTEVEVSIDEKSKIYTITRIKDPNKKPIAMNNDGVKITGSEKSSIQIAKHAVTVSGEVIKTIGNIDAKGDIELDTKDKKDLPDKISVIGMYKEIQEIKGKLSENNDVGK